MCDIDLFKKEAVTVQVHEEGGDQVKRGDRKKKL
jgi:hypothetical protein